MARRITGIFLIFLFVLSVMGCAGSPVRRAREAARNRSSLVNLKVGMIKKQVIDVVGEPSKTEAYEIGDKRLEIWFYLTEYGWTEYTGTTRLEYTPLVFEDEVLKGWGNQALRIYGLPVSADKL
jgi:hypothetical protein